MTKARPLVAGQAHKEGGSCDAGFNGSSSSRVRDRTDLPRSASSAAKQNHGGPIRPGPGAGLSRDCAEDALDGHANRRRATVTFIIPTRCLGHPEWVRTGASSYVVPNDYHVEWRDDARAPYRRPDPGGIYIDPTYGPEIPVGP